RVLDVAAGPGPLTFAAARSAAHVVAVDFADGMVEQVRVRAQREGVGNVEAVVMDAQSLALPDASFDAAFCMFGFMFFPDRERAFRELHRVLRPGGRALVATWAPIERRPMMKIGFESLAEAIPQLPPMTKGDLQQPDECMREMSGGGFRDVSAQPFTAAMRVDSAEHYLRVMERAGAPFVALRKKLGAEAWAQAEVRLLAAVRRRIPDGGVDLAAEAILTMGIR
ncbi:MAG TPA: methyltransferase domain-containing protein, partial [Albitalea sp.]|nr:methyltransferase domain-containing protein [Albitalea sp.]